MVYNHVNNCDVVEYLVDMLNIDQNVLNLNVPAERDKFNKIIYSVATVKD